MTNFPNPRPYIHEEKILPVTRISHDDKMKAIREAVKIIRENKRIVEEAKKRSNENLHR